MAKRPDWRAIGRAEWLTAVALLAAGCTPWQAGDIAPAYANATTHRGSEALAFDGASTTLASGGWGGEIAIWNVGDSTPARVWQAHDGFVLGVEFAGRQLVSGGQDGRLVLWDRDGTMRSSIDTGSGIWHLAVLNRRVFTGHYDGSVRAFSLPTLDNVMHLALHDGGPVTALAVDEASGNIASSGNDGRVFLIDAHAEPRELARPPTDARSLSFAPGGRMLYGGGWLDVFVWDLDAASFELLSTPHWGAIAGLQYLAKERVLASISRVNDSSVLFLDPVTGAGLRHFVRQSICGTTVRVSPNERYMAATGDDGVVRVWDLTAVSE